ncbi:unnamed protein product [Brassicogethes aeneus]|uniref:Uncharacterized protein n=1 Tax=Brassicogethes aeneus TaxID=1431903 RepID=A0A9P0FKC1_BRAAE|nr:unnamed protein product [Brassicogethes aeneus]
MKWLANGDGDGIIKVEMDRGPHRTQDDAAVGYVFQRPPDPEFPQYGPKQLRWAHGDDSIIDNHDKWKYPTTNSKLDSQPFGSTTAAAMSYMGQQLQLQHHQQQQQQQQQQQNSLVAGGLYDLGQHHHQQQQQQQQQAAKSMQPEHLVYMQAGGMPPMHQPPPHQLHHLAQQMPPMRQQQQAIDQLKRMGAAVFFIIFLCRFAVGFLVDKGNSIKALLCMRVCMCVCGMTTWDFPPQNIKEFGHIFDGTYSSSSLVLGAVHKTKTQERLKAAAAAYTNTRDGRRLAGEASTAAQRMRRPNVRSLFSFVQSDAECRAYRSLSASRTPQDRPLKKVVFELERKKNVDSIGDFVIVLVTVLFIYTVGATANSGYVPFHLDMKDMGPDMVGLVEAEPGSHFQGGLGCQSQHSVRPVCSPLVVYLGCTVANSSSPPTRLSRKIYVSRRCRCRAVFTMFFLVHDDVFAENWPESTNRVNFGAGPIALRPFLHQQGFV